ncbi:Trm112 family protein [Aliikangiella sp. IMCC44359]|uniref:Trm112 family protein n=1 Tax=Aliikangiella sp. IMCC44359 TaxID=3459125 RepID=UPI00403B26AA
MDSKLLDILVCPLCNSKLSFIKEEKQLLCKFDRLSFPFDEDIPVLLPERATSLTREQVEKFE